MQTRSFVAALSGAALIALTFGGCASGGPSSSQALAPAEFTLVFLRTGPNPEASTEELFGGHFAFMKQLAEAGDLLIAGPFGPDKHEEDLRGIFLIDEGDLAAARELAAGDPPTQAGVFRQEAVGLTTLDVIRTLPEMETRRQAERRAAGEDMEQPDIRAYTILTAPDGEAVAQSVFRHPAIAQEVVLLARMGEPRKGELFAMLDIATAAEVRQRLAVANPEGHEIHVDEWYGSPTIAELARTGGLPAEDDD